MPQDYSDVNAVYPLKFYSIVGVDTALEQFVISGDRTLRFVVGDLFVVVSSTGNDGTFTVASTAHAVGPNQTTITVNEDITDATVDGTIVHDEIPDFLNASETRDTVSDRDSDIPLLFAGAHTKRLSNDLREVSRNANQGLGFSVIDGGGLVIYFGSGSVIFGSGAPFDGVPGILTMTDNDTNFIEVDSAAVVTSNVVGFSTGQYPLFKVTTLSGDITKIEDKRSAITIVKFGDATLDDFGPKFDPSTELTISGGVITATQGVHSVDTEADSASDDLDTINGFTDGLMIRIRAENTARTVVIKDGTGNIESAGGDISLINTKQFVLLQFDAGLGKWVVVWGGDATENLDDLGPSFDPATELTIAAGVITITQGLHRIDTEADAASDDLDTIDGGTDGLLLMLRAENDARTVVIKDGTGNIRLSGGDMSLANDKQFVHLQFDGTLSEWVIVLGSEPTGWADDGTVVRLKTATDSVGIGTATPDASAILEIASTIKAVLPPRMTTAQIDAISSPATGLVAFDTDENLLRIRKPGEWCHVPCGVVTGQFSDSTDQKPGVTTPVVITFDTNDITLKGLSHSVSVDPEEFTADVGKSFTFMLAPQWERTSGGPNETIDFFVQLDTGAGFVDVVNSNIKMITGGVESGVAPLMYTLNLSKDDKVRFMQKVTATTEGLGIVATAAGGGIPATPSVILTVFSGD